jgi:hypothetical protein
MLVDSKCPEKLRTSEYKTVLFNLSLTARENEVVEPGYNYSNCKPDWAYS